MLPNEPELRERLKKPSNISARLLKSGFAFWVVSILTRWTGSRQLVLWRSGGDGDSDKPDDELEGEFARVAEVIDNSEADQAEAILYHLANHIELDFKASSHPGVVPPAEKDPFESVLEDLLDVDPLRIACLVPLSDLLGRCGTDADAWENLLGIPVKFSGIRMVLSAKGWKKVKTLIFYILAEEAIRTTRPRRSTIRFWASPTPALRLINFLTLATRMTQTPPLQR